MEDKLKKFEEFSDNVSIANFSDTEKNWDARRIVNKNNHGKDTYVMGDQRIYDLEKKIEELKSDKNTTNWTEISKLSQEISKFKKDKKNSVNLWIYKEYPSGSDKVLYMTEDQAKEINDALTDYRIARDRYNNLVDQYKEATTTNPNFHRPKSEL